MADYKKYEPIFGSWYIKRKIGAGSFGEVFEIERSEFGKTYRSALKIMSVPTNDEEVKSMMVDGTDLDSVATYYEGVVQDIAEENAIMSELKGNSNIVSYEDHQIIPHEDGIGYDILIRMELLTSLLDHMLRHPMTENDVLKLGIDLCQALTLCEQKNILHRDIKPGNIFISDAGDYKLGDFGIARTIEKTTSEMSRKGTYTYMAPEVYKGEKYGIRADIYSLGIVMYFLLNCKRTPLMPLPPDPVTYNAKMDALQRRMSGEPLPAPKEANPRLAEVVLKACAYDQKDRFASPEEFRAALEATGKGGSVALQHGASAKANKDDNTEQTMLLKADAAEHSSSGTNSSNARPAGRQPSVQGTPRMRSEMPAGMLAAGMAGAGSRGRRPGAGPARNAGAYTGPDDRTVLDVGQFTAEDYSRSFRNQPQGRPVAAPHGAGGKKPNGGAGKKIALVIAAVLVLGFASFLIASHLLSEPKSPDQSTELQVGDIKILGSDINYSQLGDKNRRMTLERDGVDMLIKVQNNGKVPLRAFKFRVKLEGHSENLEDIQGKDLFEAYGFVKQGQKGYMYAHLYLPNTTSHDQAGEDYDQIYPDRITAEGDLGEYDIPKGKIKKFHDSSDSYDAKVMNGNPEIKINATATILAFRKDIDDHSKLDRLWGAGTVGQDISGNDEETIKGAIYNPGFDDPYDYDRYEVYVYDHDFLADPDFPGNSDDEEE